MEASSWGSEIGEEGIRPSTLLLDIPVLIFADGSGLAARMRAAVRSLFLAMAAAELHVELVRCRLVRRVVKCSLIP